MHNDDETLAVDATALLRATFAPLDDTVLVTLERGLDDEEPRLRVLALRGLARHRRLTPDALARFMVDTDPEVRREAARLSVDLPDDPALDLALATALGDLDALVCESAAFALGERGVEGSLERLVEVAGGHDDPRCREAAVVALGTLGLEGGLDAVIAALDDRPPVRRRAVVALSNFTGPRVDAAIARALEDRDWQVRSAAEQLGVSEVL